MKTDFLEAQHNDPSNSNGTTFPSPPHLRPPSSTHAASFDIVRRPRGRPLGSRNRPKPPVIVARDASEPPSMCPYILEIPAGADVIDCAERFCRRRNIGLCVLNGNGTVSTVTLRQPSVAAAITFHGRFEILSISATVRPAADGSFAIFLAGPQGQVVGGNAVGPLVAAGTVYLIAAKFDSPTVIQLPAADGEDPGVGEGGEDRRESPLVVSGGDGGGAPLYPYQPSDVIWTPTGRQTPPSY